MEITQTYAVDRDVIFYATLPHMTPINLDPGQSSSFSPPIGHAGGLECDSPSEVRKVVIKVRA